jgi:uncharacterized protein (TIGR03437 family)
MPSRIMALDVITICPMATRASLLKLALWLCLPKLAGAAVSLAIPNQVVGPGQILATAVSLSSQGAAVGGLQFDLEWDGGLQVQIVTGSSLAKAGKQLYSHSLADRRLRILIVGFDAGMVEDGEMVRLFVTPTLSSGTADFRVTNALGTTPAGDAIAIASTSATIRIDPVASGASLLAGTVLNAASLQAGAVAPGEIVTVLGAFGIAADAKVGVSFNDVSATVLYALGNQVNFVAPSGLNPSKPATLSVTMQGRRLGSVAVPAASASPAVFSQDGSGIGLGAILNQDYSYNSPSNSAPAGSIVMLFGTGLGVLNPPAVDGAPGVISSAALPVSVKIGGIGAQVSYAGAAPGLAAGVVQINVQIPAGIPPGLASVAVNAGSFSSPAGIRIAVR